MLFQLCWALQTVSGDPTHAYHNKYTQANKTQHSRENAMLTQLYGSGKTLFHFMATGSLEADDRWAAEAEWVYGIINPGKPIPRQPREGIQGDRKIPANDTSLELAAEICNFPTNEGFMKHLQVLEHDESAAFPHRRTRPVDDGGPRLKEPDDLPKTPKPRSQSGTKKARVRYYDNLVARAYPDMPGVTPYDSGRMYTRPSLIHEEWATSTHLPKLNTPDRARATLVAMRDGDDSWKTRWFPFGLRAAVARARTRARTASGVSAEAADSSGAETHQRPDSEGENWSTPKRARGSSDWRWSDSHWGGHGGWSTGWSGWGGGWSQG